MAHTRRCGEAKVIPWTECTCQCDGALHPDNHRGGYYHILGGPQRATARRTAIPEGESQKRAIVVFALAVKAVHPTFSGPLGREICRLLDLPFVLSGNVARKPPSEISSSHEAGTKLMALYDKLSAGGVDLNQQEASIAALLLPDSTTESPTVLLLFALLMCGYLGDSPGFQPISRTVEDLRNPLVVRHVLGRPAEAHTLHQISQELLDASSHEEDLRRVVAELRPDHGRMVASGVGPELELHFVCTVLVAIVYLLSIRGKLIDLTAETIGAAVENHLSQEFGHSIGRLGGFVAKKTVIRLAGKTGSDLGGASLKMACQLLAVVACPNVSSHPEVDSRCLRPLAGALLKESVKREANVRFGFGALD